VALDSLFGGDVTGASMNPARSFGPALVASEWTDFWIYILAPVTGAIAAALFYGVVRKPTTGVDSDSP
jgi:glycerol uptake facilitator-like aquaporin